MTEALLTAKAVGARLGLAPKTVYKLVQQGVIKGLYLPAPPGVNRRTVRIPESSLDEYLDRAELIA